MSLPLGFPPSQSLHKVETVKLSGETELVFFHQVIEYVASNTQLLLSLFVDPSGCGHLDSLRGVAVQIDADTGVVLDSLRKGQPIGRLDRPLRGHSKVKLSIHLQQFSGISIPHLAVSNESGSLGHCELDKTVFRDNETMILPAFRSYTNEQISAFMGYYTEDQLEPTFNDHSICLWPDDAPQGG